MIERTILYYLSIFMYRNVWESLIFSPKHSLARPINDPHSLPPFSVPHTQMYNSERPRQSH